MRGRRIIDRFGFVAGAIWALPWTLLGLIIGVVALATGGGVLFHPRLIEFHGGILRGLLRRVPIAGGAAAMTLGHVVIGQNRDALDACREHELVHVRQYQRWGIFFIPAYLAASAYLWMRGRNAYRGNPFEVEAYRHSEACMTQHTKGRVEWIGVSSGPRSTIESIDQSHLIAGKGLLGDYHGKSKKTHREVTLIQAEEFSTIAAALEGREVTPDLTRRNIVVSGIDLKQLRDARFHVGSALLEGTGDCHPCARMEENLGAGGRKAMKGRGGITARVLSDGAVRVGDQVALATANTQDEERTTMGAQNENAV